MGKVQQSVTRFDPIASMRISVRPRSGLERNDGVKSHSSHTSLIEVLAARYPVIRRLVGELSFRIVARRFILSEPPSIAISPSYGDNFPRFLRGEGNAAFFEYVASKAQWLAHHAASFGLLGSVTFPDRDDRENNQSGDESGMIDRWSAEAALVARPFFAIEVHRLPPGGYTFARALSEGKTVTIAVRAATAATSKFDVTSNLALLVDANVIVGIHEAA